MRCQARGQRASSSFQNRTGRQVLFICKHEQQAILHLPILQYPMQLLSCFVYAFPILAVHHEDETLGAGVIVPPKRADFVLTANIPYVEFDIFVCDGFHVETDWKRFEGE